MNPGKLDTYVTIQNDTGTTKDSNGEHIRSWATFCNLYVSRLGVSAKEGVISDQIINITTEEFKYRIIDGAVTSKMRMTNGTEVYDIIEVGYLDRNYGKLICTKVDND